MKEIKNTALWILAAILGFLGISIYFLLPGYSFTGLVLLGLGALVVCYRLLALLERRAITAAKLLRLILSICVCLGVLAAVVTGTFIYHAGLGNPETACEYVVVLGCGVNGTVPSLSLRNRIDGAYAYLVAHPDAICVVSGGQGPGEDITEAACMKRELVAMGIDPDRIWEEDKSTSTQENLEYSLAVIEANAGFRPTTIGIVSAEYHLYRASLMAADQGVTAVGIPGKTTWFTLWANYHMREIVAVWAYLIFGG